MLVKYSLDGPRFPLSRGLSHQGIPVYPGSAGGLFLAAISVSRRGLWFFCSHHTHKGGVHLFHQPGQYTHNIFQSIMCPQTIEHQSEPSKMLRSHNGNTWRNTSDPKPKRTAPTARQKGRHAVGQPLGLGWSVQFTPGVFSKPACSVPNAPCTDKSKALL